MISSLHYISQGKDQAAHLTNTIRMLEAGANWIQLRLKEMPEQEILETALSAKNACLQYGAKLIINDYPEIAKASDVDGVHLGKDDMSPIEARKILGANKIIGGTANTLEDCLRLLHAGVDYIGLGPLRFTTTKQKLSPILGFDGYEQLLGTYLKDERAVPVIAIGGVVTEDIPILKGIGLHGVAISGLLTNAEKPELVANEIIECLKN
ncbi:thiamine phosphate synthase [Marinoscillum sp. MHG1-6]|uniref:thiamine phosphate synthase n=1 Tax=Marinoscillum sp. MHG1-6 TaxID=2959627 RepID=UPI0021573696|nr:thiamine phosphate synthase [Marinoscillum sp. MHG1-6]